MNTKVWDKSSITYFICKWTFIIISLFIKNWNVVLRNNTINFSSFFFLESSLLKIYFIINRYFSFYNHIKQCTTRNHGRFYELNLFVIVSDIFLYGYSIFLNLMLRYILLNIEILKIYTLPLSSTNGYLFEFTATSLPILTVLVANDHCEEHPRNKLKYEIF